MVITNNDGSSSVTTQAKREALAEIEEQFFGNPARGELLPYQRLLREARQARARGDFKAERQYYKQVLDLLHTETWGSSSAVARSPGERHYRQPRPRPGTGTVDPHDCRRLVGARQFGTRFETHPACWM